MNTTKAIIFDFFDVIHSDPFRRWLKKHGYQRTGDFEESSRLVDSGKISDAEFYQRLSELSGQSFESVQADFGSRGFIDQQMVQLIATLGTHYKIGLLSNSSSQYLRPLLEKHDLLKLFNELVISSEVGLIKPSAAIFEHILKKLAVQPDQAIFIDDTPQNVVQASALGIKALTYSGDIQQLKQQLSKLGVVIT